MQQIKLTETPMTREVMEELEKKGLIILMGPGKHRIYDAEEGAGKTKLMYVAEKTSGPHKLIACTKNITKIVNFGCHSDNEEFLLIGQEEAKPLYLLVGLLPIDELRKKGDTVGFDAEDFVLLRCKFNDPYCSFFTMLHETPHTEFTVRGDRLTPTFYVTEPDGMVNRYSSFQDIDFVLPELI